MFSTNNVTHRLRMDGNCSFSSKQSFPTTKGSLAGKAECPRVLIFYFRQIMNWQTGCIETVISDSRY